MTVVQEIGGCVAADLTDPVSGSEQDELASQVKSVARPDVVVVSGRHLVVPGATTVTPNEWRQQVLLLLR